MKVIHQKHYPTLQVDSNENDIVQIAQNGKEDFNLIMLEKERARCFALLVCPELAHLEGALLAEQELNNQLKEEIERLKAKKKKLIEDFVDWAKDCGEDAWYIFENTEESIERFVKHKSK